MGQAFERWNLVDLVIDAGSQTVVRGQEAIALPKLSFHFLLELVRAAPNVLTVDDLMDRVWPGIFVNAETVTQRAKLLRDALGDDPKEPRYFVARRGIGYQLLAAPKKLAPEEAEVLRTKRSWRWKAALAALFLTPALALGLTRYNQSVQHAVAAPLRVAVLPFENLSSDPADAFIAQGIPEMVLNRLSSVSGLAVISRESALVSKVAKSGPVQAARQLDADFIVTGSVQRQGGMLRVTAFVLDSAKGTRLWSRSYDWPVDRLYALQDQIAGQVARSLSARTSASLQLASQKGTAGNPEAYLAYLKGRSLLGRFRVADTEAAAKQFQRATDLDPGFAPALVALFDARMQAASLRSEDLAPVRERYGPLLDKASAIDPQSGPLLFAQAMWSNLPRERRLALFREAAERDPSNSRGLTAYAQLLEWGRQDASPSVKSRQLMDKVMALDPLSADAQFWSVQRMVFDSKPPAEVEAAQRRALSLDPENILLANRFAVRRWRFGGQTAEAITLMERILASDPQYARNAHVAFAMYLDVGDVAAARAVAQSTSATRESSRVALSLYNRDWRAAGEAALGPRGFLFNQFENWLWPEAVRDLTLNSGQFDRGAQAIASRFGFDLSNPKVTTLYQMTPSVPLAQILLAQGKTDQAARLLAGAVRWLDEHSALGLAGGTGRAKAGALMLLGQRDQALSVLLATTQGAHDIRHCWYLVGQDPVWAPVRGDPRFRHVAALCAASISEQRALLEAARKAGKVPRRA